MELAAIGSHCGLGSSSNVPHSLLRKYPLTFRSIVGEATVDSAVPLGTRIQLSPNTFLSFERVQLAKLLWILWFLQQVISNTCQIPSDIFGWSGTALAKLLWILEREGKEALFLWVWQLQRRY